MSNHLPRRPNNFSSLQHGSGSGSMTALFNLDLSHRVGRIVARGPRQSSQAAAPRGEKMGSVSFSAPPTNSAPLAAYKGADELGEFPESCRQDNVALGVDNW